MLDPTQRFSTRVDNYVKYRPGYPKAILALLRRDCGLTPASVIADIGSGTGISSRAVPGERQPGLRRGAEPGDARGGGAAAGEVSALRERPRQC